MGGNTSNARIDQVKGSVKIKASDLNRLVSQVTPFTDMAIEPDKRTKVTDGQASDPTVAAMKLSGKTKVAGRDLRITAYGSVSLVNGQVMIAVNDVELDDMALDGLDAVLGVVRQALSVTIDPGALPFTVTPTAVKVESGAFTLEGSINDILLDQGATR